MPATIKNHSQIFCQIRWKLHKHANFCLFPLLSFSNRISQRVSDKHAGVASVWFGVSLIVVVNKAVTKAVTFVKITFHHSTLVLKEPNHKNSLSCLSYIYKLWAHCRTLFCFFIEIWKSKSIAIYEQFRNRMLFIWLPICLYVLQNFQVIFKGIDPRILIELPIPIKVIFNNMWTIEILYVFYLKL